MQHDSINKLRQSRNGLGRALLCLEVNPPKGIDLTNIEERLAPHIQDLDFFNVTDNALAIMRMAALPMAAWLKSRFKIEPLVNLSARDRNLIGIQSDLLAAWMQEVRSLVALTGDAVSIGDHKQSKAVFEVNSLGLLEVINRLNKGYDLSGNELLGKTDFLAGAVANPNAKNPDAELRKLAKKIEAGANYILTQPVFDEDSSQYFLKQAAEFKKPIMLGLMPIGSIKVARNLNKIPGLRLSPQIEGMLDSCDDATLRKYSMELCLKLAHMNRPYISGYHVVSGVTPKLALKLLTHLKTIVSEEVE